MSAFLYTQMYYVLRIRTLDNADRDISASSGIDTPELFAGTGRCQVYVYVLRST
jgi:hypothetical protein